MRAKKVFACDCETPPFLHGRANVKPFIWGLYDGKNFETFHSTESFVESVRNRRIIMYAHNGGKFDFMFLLPYILETKAQIINGRIVSMYLGECELRDSFAIIPEALKKFGAKGEIDYWKLEEEHRDKYADEILAYLKTDCTILWDAVTRYREQAGKYKTIASNALAFSKKLGIDPGKTNARFDEQFRPFYYGGRTECFQPGTHKDITLIDIHSAYPFAMTHDHASSSDFFWRNDFGDLSEEEITRSFIVIECMSRGAFPKRTNSAAGLHFPHEYDEYHVTGWEYLAARDLGLIDNIKIHSVRWTPNTINFKAYVKHWYDYKAAHPRELFPIEYVIGKIMMNSLYGKLAQNPARYKDYKIVAAGTPVDSENGWTLETEYDGHEIHARESLWKWKYEYGVEWKAKSLYKNVATGASITGFTRAHLLRAMHTLGMEHVIYCDTDGIACSKQAKLESLALSDALGDWGIEEQCAPISHFAGKKLYGVKLSSIDPKTKKNKEKIASKGSKLTFQHLERLVAGETVTWKSEAPTFRLDGSFDYIVRDIRSTALKPKATVP